MSKMKLQPYNMAPYKSQAIPDKLTLPHEDKHQNLSRRLGESKIRDQAFGARQALSKKQQNTCC